MRLSREFLIAVKLADRPMWKIAAAAGVSPTVLSRWLSGYQRVRPDDPRLLRVAAALGVPPDRLFESGPEPAAAGDVEHARQARLAAKKARRPRPSRRAS
jgi:transcriptional regulator with XRE-family HTH domain